MNRGFITFYWTVKGGDEGKEFLGFVKKWVKELLVERWWARTFLRQKIVETHEDTQPTTPSPSK